MATEYEQPAAISLQEIVPQQKFTLPTGLTFFPGNNKIMYLLQQDGMIWRLVDDGGEIIVNPFVDLREYYNVVYLPEGLGGCNECGLYSMVFHPNFNQNGYIYISFTTDGANGRPLQTHIKRFRSSDNGVSLAQDNSGKLEETVIFEIQQPANLHNNGQIRFGPDGYLYIGMGDGGYSLDAQNVHNPFGSILRVTDEGEPAPGNLVQGGLPELYAIGLRNPWFWSFDRLTGDLWAGDVGHAKIEEVNRIFNGGNYGWPCFEGNATYINCGSSGPFENPVWDYGRVDGSSVTGGYVYRGRVIESLYGTYLFSDFLSGIIWGLREIPGESGYERVQLIASGKAVSAFAEDNDGELYILDYTEGGIYRLVPTINDSTKKPLPVRLSETGCMNIRDVTQPDSKLLPYSINEPFWSDGADKERFISLPEKSQIEVDDQGDFHFPVGTILLKNFRLQGKLIETRLLLNQENSGWSGYSYAWNDDVTEAILLETSEDREFGGQIWHYPSRAECRQCHTSAAGFSLGLEIAQLNRISPNTGQNQLDWFVERNLFSSELGPHQLALKLPGSKDLSASLGERARAFLHSNCSYCHRPGGTSQSNMDLRFGTELIFTNTCGVEPIQGDLGIASALLLAPGVADRSLIWQRISANNENKMPPLARNHVDMESAELIRDWINNMDFCRTIAGPLDGKYALHKDENTILGRTNSLPALVNTDSENKVEWQIKPAIENFYHISLVGDDDLFLHYENLKLSIGPIRPEWWSAHWELIAEEDYFLVRNRWYGHYLRVVNDSVGMAPLSDEGQYKWRIVLNPNHGG
ncbi:PQQ-dependent sugar dehydrogenase [Saccharophagus sp. K07]|uniref:PQQ-dependent sugar dehydrogenase n=1 Tax=Saccharophagus sp. K07 TaxID=2283636 RepID=UPI00165207D7|nr:PQQ-dependent sugar dehydrogenase [Saccharophagus sp. K07]